MVEASPRVQAVFYLLGSEELAAAVRVFLREPGRAEAAGTGDPSRAPGWGARMDVAVGVDLDEARQAAFRGAWQLAEADQRALARAQVAVRVALRAAGLEEARALLAVVGAWAAGSRAYAANPACSRVWRADEAASLGARNALADLLTLHTRRAAEGMWVHTHGLGQFGCPDLEVFGVEGARLATWQEAIAGLARRQVYGRPLAPQEVVPSPLGFLKTRPAREEVPWLLDYNPRGHYGNAALELVPYRDRVACLLREAGR